MRKVICQMKLPLTKNDGKPFLKEALPGSITEWFKGYIVSGHYTPKVTRMI